VTYGQTDGRTDGQTNDDGEGIPKCHLCFQQVAQNVSFRIVVEKISYMYVCSATQYFLEKILKSILINILLDLTIIESTSINKYLNKTINFPTRHSETFI